MDSAWIADTLRQAVDASCQRRPGSEVVLERISEMMFVQAVRRYLDPDFPYQAGVHVNYQETTLRVRDGLPKLKDVPKEMGGSGVSVEE